MIIKEITSERFNRRNQCDIYALSQKYMGKKVKGRLFSNGEIYECVGYVTESNPYYLIIASYSNDLMYTQGKIIYDRDKLNAKYVSFAQLEPSRGLHLMTDNSHTYCDQITSKYGALHRCDVY